MSALILDGTALAKEIRADLKERVKRIKEATGDQTPVLATILVGSDPASEVYVNMKGRACRRVGMDSLKIALPEGTTKEELLSKIDELNKDSNVHGILIQHPVAGLEDEERDLFDALDARKDVDGVTSLGFGRMSMGEAAFGSATPAGIMSLLRHYKIELSGKHAVVVGRSAILGKPMAAMLLNANCTVTVCHSRTVDLPNLVGQADIVVGAVGRPAFIKRDWIKEGAVVVDAGYNKIEGEYIGDCELDGLDGKASAYTPVPGGVGPMTIVTLIQQTVESAENSLGLSAEPVSA